MAAEFALVAVDPNRVEHAAAEGGRRARVARSLLPKLSFHLAGAQLGITVTSLLIGLLAEPTVARLLEPALRPLVGEVAVHAVSLGLSIVLATIVQMVIGELVPKGLAIARPEATTFLLAPLIRVYGLVFGPLIRLLDGSANATVRLFGIEPTEELSRVRTLPELQALVRASAESGTLEASASQLLTRSIRFESKVAEDVLIARTAVSALSSEQSVDDLVELSIRTGHSRFLVFGDDIDDVIGVVHVREVHTVPRARRATTQVGELAGPVLAVPESRGLDDVLIDLRRGDTHLAVVVDEYGGTAGIITLEDILEEIVGEIADEHDPRPERVTHVPRHGEWLLPGTLHPDELLDQTTLAIPDGEYETIAGFMLDRLGHIPGVGATITHEGWTLRVESMDRRRISEVRLRAPLYDGLHVTVTEDVPRARRRSDR